MKSEQNQNVQFGDPIIILGIAPRSGTNYLYDLIRLHPHANGCPAVYEDYLLVHASKLDHYARSVVGQWQGLENIWKRQYDDAATQAILAAMGQGLLEFLQSKTKPPRLVTKTPTPAGVDLCFHLFPKAHLLLLVRDGRSVVESAVRSRLGPNHGHRYDVFMRQWNEAAKTILAFEALYEGSGKPFQRLHYEALVTNFQTSLAQILDTCKLDPALYDEQAAASLPVRGSSTYGQVDLAANDDAQLNWTPQQRGSDFDPLRRWTDWPAERHAMFNAICGESMLALGYELVEPGSL